jgi:peptide/nickel transport system permease protein
MLRLITRRLLLSVVTLFIVSLVIFAGVELLPGDLATAFLGREATPTRLASLRAELGLDQPATERYLNWLGNVLHGNLGMSLARKEPISELLGFRMRNTLLLGLTAGLIGLPLALVLGIIAGLTRDRKPDIWISTISLILMTLPGFVTATLLILLFAIAWPIFPAVTIVPPDSPIKELLPNIALPVIALIFIMVAHNLRMVRTNMIDVMTSEYVQMATLKGIPRARVVLRHALPNALLPTINLVALYVVWLIGGVVIIEQVFNYPGIGTLMIQAVHDRDIPLVQAIVLVIAGAYVVLNMGADLLVMMLDPRLRSMRG